MEILSLVWTFFRIGIVSFGGGWSIVGIIKNAVVPRWLDDPGFASLIAIAQSTPGPVALNTATMIGWTRAGVPGSIAATLSVVAFPMMAITVAHLVGSRLPLKKQALDESLRTGSMAMMAMTLWALRPDSADPLLLAFAALTFALQAFTKADAIWIILGSGAANAVAGPAIRSLFGIPG